MGLSGPIIVVDWFLNAIICAVCFFPEKRLPLFLAMRLTLQPSQANTQNLNNQFPKIRAKRDSPFERKKQDGLKFCMCFSVRASRLETT